PAGEQVVDQLRRVLAERRAVAPHVQLARQPLDQVHAREAPLGIRVVPRRHVHPQRPDLRVAQRVPLERPAVDLELVVAAGDLRLPGLHARPPPASRRAAHRTDPPRTLRAMRKPWIAAFTLLVAGSASAGDEPAGAQPPKTYEFWTKDELER